MATVLNGHDSLLQRDREPSSTILIGSATLANAALTDLSAWPGDWLSVFCRGPLLGLPQERAAGSRSGNSDNRCLDRKRHGRSGAQSHELMPQLEVGVTGVVRCSRSMLPQPTT